MYSVPIKKQTNKYIHKRKNEKLIVIIVTLIIKLVVFLVFKLASIQSKS